MSITTMKEVVDVLDKFIFSEFNYRASTPVDLITDGRISVYYRIIGEENSEWKLFGYNTRMVPLIDARNFIVYGKARKI